MQSNLGTEDIGAEKTDAVEDSVNKSSVTQQPPRVQTLTKEKMEQKQAQDQALQERLNQRQVSAMGNPNAAIADPMMVRVEPRYTIVQNRSNRILLVPDLKTGAEDLGLSLNPGEVIVLTDFYSPQEINRSKGLRHAATEMKGVGDHMALVPLNTEEEGAEFAVPERKKYPAGTIIEDTSDNDFDDRFEELMRREAKREEKLMRKTLGMRKQKQHGAVTHT